MKKLVFGLAASAAIAATCFAGTESYSSGKTSKEYKQVETPTCFSDKEIQVDIFGAYEVGEGPNQAGPIANHGWGGGVAANYFFMRYFGLSAEGSWLDARGNGAEGGHHGGTAIQSVSGSLIFRWPIDRLCLAPYLFTGGGATMDGDKWAVYHIGAGLEYRVVPNKVGLFVDGRWNYYGSRLGSDVQNNFMIRSGVRWVF